MGTLQRICFSTNPSSGAYKQSARTYKKYDNFKIKRSLCAQRHKKKEIQKSLDTLNTETKGVGHKLFSVLQAIQAKDQEDRRKKGDSAKQRMRESVYQVQSAQVSRSWEEFVTTSQECQRSLKDRDRRHIHFVQPKLSETQIDEIMAAGQTDSVIRAALMSEELKLVVKDIDSRHQDILALERQVLELSELFKDLATLAQLQQESLDSIEGHVQKAKAHVEKGEDNLEKAEKHQKAARKKKCYLLAGGVVALAATVVTPLAVKAM